MEKTRNNHWTDSCVNMYGDFMYPKLSYGSYGYNPEKGRFPLDYVNTLSVLKNPLRRRTCVEKWSPMEVTLFESCITLYGKKFHEIQKHINGKTTKEIIEFYYFWKKTSHYKDWKKIYVVDDRDYTDSATK
jgi:hypothetical protein